MNEPRDVLVALLAALASVAALTAFNPPYAALASDAALTNPIGKVQEYVEASAPSFVVGEYWTTCMYSEQGQLAYDQVRGLLLNWTWTYCHASVIVAAQQ